MKLHTLALDYDGTIAIDGVLDPGVRDAIAHAHAQGIIVVLVTGRIRSDLQRLLNEPWIFDVIVAENGAVLHFPHSSRSILLGQSPPPVFAAELRCRDIPFLAGECVVEMDAQHAAAALSVIHDLQLPLSDSAETKVLRKQFDSQSDPQDWVEVLRNIETGQAALLPGAEESGERLVRFRLSRRITAHVRHKQKYLNVPVAPGHSFVFTHDGVPTGDRARTLAEFEEILLRERTFTEQLTSHDFSRWIQNHWRHSSDRGRPPSSKHGMQKVLPSHL